MLALFHHPSDKVDLNHRPKNNDLKHSCSRHNSIWQQSARRYPQWERDNVKILLNKVAYFALRALIVVSPIASVAADDVAGRKTCPIPPSQPAETCVDASCAARAKQQLDKQLECHKQKMAQLSAQSTVQTPVASSDLIK